MNKILKLNVAIFLIVLLNSCGEKVVFKTDINQPNQVWNIYKPAVFDVDIQDTSKTYKISVALKLNHRMQERFIPIDIQTLSPNGESRAAADYLIMDSALTVGEFSEFVIQSNKHFNSPGKYHFSITQRTAKYDLEGIESIGLRVKTTKLKKITEE